MTDNGKYTLKYAVEKLEYNLGTCSDEPMIIMLLRGFRFGEGNRSYADFGGGGLKISNAMFLYLNRTTFLELTGRQWDCTPSGVDALKKDLEGKVFKLDFDMRGNGTLLDGKV